MREILFHLTATLCGVVAGVRQGMRRSLRPTVEWESGRLTAPQGRRWEEWSWRRTDGRQSSQIDDPDNGTTKV